MSCNYKSPAIQSQYLQPERNKVIYENNTVNIATIIFVLLALIIGAIALTFGVIAYVNYRDLLNQRQNIPNVLKISYIPASSINVAPNNGIVILSFGTTSLTVASTQFRNIISVNFRNDVLARYISSYPFTVNQATVSVSIPLHHAVSEGLIVNNNGIYYVAPDWKAVVVFRNP